MFQKINKTKIIVATLFSAAIFFSLTNLAKVWRKTHAKDEKIEVTGAATKDFVSDLIVWRASYLRRSFVLADANNLLKKDAELVKNMLVKKGIDANTIIFNQVNVQKMFRNNYNQEGRMTESVFDGYELTQNIEVESKEVDKLEKISRESTELLDNGVEFTSYAPEYYYTKLSDLKLEMLKSATSNGFERANNIVNSAKGDIGKLIKADMGTFQITGQNKNEEYSWGGTLNTTDKRKTASVTVKLSFELN